MKKYLLAVCASFFLISLSVFAAGGGGGGGGGGGTSSPDPVPVQETIAPVVTAPAATTCIEDTWTCNQWSPCQQDGRQSRTCTLAQECTAAETPKPAETQICPGLKCGQLATLKERVQCRLELKPKELQTEFSILYFPEYCKVEESTEKQMECIGLYQAFKPCWALPISPERLTCGKKVSGISVSPENDRAQCLRKKSSSQSACLKEVKVSAENYMLFQMYEYEFRAEDQLKKSQATLLKVAEFDVFVEKIKREVDKSEDTKVWKNLLQKIQKKFKTEFSLSPAK